jgi:predicted protein tyrosine phosphatase
MFEFLYGFDHPCNLFPSLHVAILIILCRIYHRHSRGILRGLISSWFGLIGLSTVLTYQHHVVDVAGGLALGLLCCYLIPDHRLTHPKTTNARVGRRYFAASVVLGAVAVWLRPWGLVLLWPAASTAIVAAAYFGLCSNVTRKQHGRVPLAARWVMAPWLATQQASLIYYRRRAEPWNAVTPDVWIGRQLREREATAAVRQGVKAVLDLTGEFSEAAAFRALPYLNLPVLDLTAPAPCQLRSAIDFINAHRDQGVVYVHCKIGYSRSAAVIGAWIIDAQLASTSRYAIGMLRAVRPSVIVRCEVVAALQAFHNQGPSVDTPPPSFAEVRA